MLVMTLALGPAAPLAPVGDVGPVMPSRAVLLMIVGKWGENSRGLIGDSLASLGFPGVAACISLDWSIYAEVFSCAYFLDIFSMWVSFSLLVSARYSIC